MSAIKCSKPRAKHGQRRRVRDAWTQYCVAEELDQPHAVNEFGQSFEHLILSTSGTTFGPGTKIRHKNGATLDNRRDNLEIVQQ